MQLKHGSEYIAVKKPNYDTNHLSADVYTANTSIDRNGILAMKNYGRETKITQDMFDRYFIYPVPEIKDICKSIDVFWKIMTDVFRSESIQSRFSGRGVQIHEYVKSKDISNVESMGSYIFAITALEKEETARYKEEEMIVLCHVRYQVTVNGDPGYHLNVSANGTTMIDCTITHRDWIHKAISEIYDSLIYLDTFRKPPMDRVKILLNENGEN